jgi:hypothetical protein
MLSPAALPIVERAVDVELGLLGADASDITDSVDDSDCVDCPMLHRA